MRIDARDPLPQLSPLNRKLREDAGPHLYAVMQRINTTMGSAIFAENPTLAQDMWSVLAMAEGRGPRDGFRKFINLAKGAYTS